MNQVKSAYNFVPAPEEQEVFIPSWAEQISHDIPFEDGESGEIEVEITAETPIFIRNGYAKGNEDKEFSHIKKFDEKNQEILSDRRYFIPATSLKGMTRNVLEIMSFSRLNKSLVNNDRYSFRDLSSTSSEYMRSYDTNKVKAGWLKEDQDGNWFVEECSYNHIHHSEVDRALGTNFRKLFLETPAKDIKKSGEYKYKLCNDKQLTSTFSLKESQSKPKGVAFYDPNGKKGTIVFTGQNGPRKEPKDKKPSGKVHEFVFFEGIKKTYKISQKDKKDFKFIYLDHDKNNISPDWKFWKEELSKNGKVPVFFNQKNDSEIKHFGLSYMYKLPYEHSVHEMFPLATYKNSQDLATTIFGLTDKDNSLKGRVFFGNALATKAFPMNTSKEILGGPKASFTPFYIEQKNSNSLSSYQQQGSLKGFKKYPIHSKISKPTYSSDQLKNEKVFSYFSPLDKGSSFVFKIKYHNLKQCELGALVSALSFHNNSNSYFHTLGGVKNLGFGSVKLDVLNINKFKTALQKFEYEMNLHCTKTIKNQWLNSIQLKELFSMSAKPSSEVEEFLIAPGMGKDGRSDKNEFVEYRANKSFLKGYSNYNPISSIDTLLSKEVLTNWEEERKSIELEKEKAKIELKNKYELLIKTAYEKLNEFNFEDAKNSYYLASKIHNDNSLEQFLKEIDNKQKEKEELDVYNKSISENTQQSYETFILNYPLSNYKQDIEQRLSKLKAVSGIPENVSNKNNLKQFADNTDNWVKKMKRDGHSIASLGFFDEHKKLLLTIWEIEKNNSKLSKEWFSDKTKKRFIDWYGITITEEIIQKLK